MKTPVFKGSCTAMITPFTENGIDFKRMGELLDYQEKNGTAAVLVAGTTGESATLEIHEYEQLVDFCVRYLSGRMKVIVGIGGNNTLSCLSRAKQAEAAGADAVIMTAPYYNKSTQRGVVEHFTYVADRTEAPVMIYNIPSRTSVSISLESYRELAKHPNINGVKESGGDFSLIARTAACCGNDLYIWSGNDDQTVPMMALGAQGVISVASNIIPETMSILCSLCLNGDFAAAAQLYFRYSGLFANLFIETNPIPVKAAMGLMGMDSGILRRPLTEISDRSLAVLAESLKSAGLVY